jgi:nitrite reductase/ring-hydroxylating ferredoxin subunit
VDDFDDDRRRLCQAALALAASSALPACGGGSAASCKSAPLATENVSASAVNTGVKAIDIPVDGAVPRMSSEINVFLCRDECGLYAVDAGCTHLGCNVSFVSAQSGFSCKCHGATYDFNGGNPTRPAPSPLKHYAIEILASGEVLVDVSPQGVVDANVRLKG